MAKTHKPTGLSIKRNGSTFTFSWKIGDADYGDGQFFDYRLDKTDSKDSWKSINIGTKTAAKSVSIDKSKYYPNKAAKLKSVDFRVKGNRKSYTTGSGTKEVTHNPSVSDWVSKEYEFHRPRVPSLFVNWDEGHSNVCVFSWSTKVDNTDSYVYTDAEWQTMLVKNNKETDGSKLSWKSSRTGWQTGSSTAASSSKTITEDTALLAESSYTRWFRVRSRGPRGASDWRYSNHVYAIPFQAEISSVSVKKVSLTGYKCTLSWFAQRNAAHPIDVTTVQYAKAIPAEGGACPSGATWEDANVSKDTSGKDSAVFTIDGLLEDDQCLFVRVVTEHDSNVAYSQPKLALYGKLAEPSGLSVTVNQENRRATITVTNNSQVPDSRIAISYRPSKGSPVVIAVLPHGTTTDTVVYPDAYNQLPFGFGVRAFVGTADYSTLSDGAKVYSITESMKSDLVTSGGDVPVAPNIIRTTVIDGNTARLDWAWNWTKATGAELSWADHEDAWESTEQPETFEVSDISRSVWSIRNLESGKVWFIRIRFFMDDSDGNRTYGPYSDAEPVDLSAAPAKPLISVNNSVITPKGFTLVSWSYESGDGTPQGYAEVGELSGSTYEPIVHTTTRKQIRINAEEQGWTNGSQHILAVRVQSKSEKMSEWSDPIAVNVAEPLDCEITQTSLIDEIVSDSVSLLTDNSPYLFRKTGGDLSVGNKAVEKLVGGSVVWNQLARDGNFDTDGVWNNIIGTLSQSNNIGSYRVNDVGTYAYSNSITQYLPTTIRTHKYLCFGYVKPAHNKTDVRFWINGGGSGSNQSTAPVSMEASKWNLCSGIINCDREGGYFQFALDCRSTNGYAVGDVDELKQVNCFDLTQMFGSAVADRLYAMEQANAGSGVALFRSWFPKDYYEYNTGTLMSVKTTAHEMVGFNQWDEVWESGDINVGNGEKRANGNRIRSKNFIPVVPNTAYYFNSASAGGSFVACFYDENKNWVSSSEGIGWDDLPSTKILTTPSWCRYLMFYQNGTTYNHDICISISSDRNGEYQPYTKHTYALDDVELRGIPKLDASNNVYFDGDIYENDGTVVRRYGVVDLGSLNWNLSSNENYFYSTGLPLPAKMVTRNLTNGKGYGLTTYANGIDLYQGTTDKVLGVALSSISSSLNSVYVRDTAYATSASFKSAMSGVYLVYELATPTTETVTEFEEIQDVYPDGCEKFIDERDVPIPVGHETQYAPAGESLYKTKSLKDLPLTATIQGAGAGGVTSMVIERAESYHMDRPDERDFDGYEGETIVSYSQLGEDQISIDSGELVGALDDNAKYRIIATIMDGLGQVDEATEEFEVHWAHQAEKPSATVVYDEENLIAKITPIAPAGALSEDRCDIYRLSVDRPELVVKDAQFGTTYVDPYPALGEMGGYRLVTVTKNGDYTTEDNEIAWVSSAELGVNPLDNEDSLNIIDFDGDQVRFYYDNDLSNTWDKDFQETHYLGGSVTGDWNVAVSRSSTLSTLVITELDQDMIRSIRRLAVYPGICHVRTSDGSSYAANAEVNENKSHTDRDMVLSYSLNFTRVDTQGFDGMTLEQWNEQNPTEEE